MTKNQLYFSNHNILIYFGDPILLFFFLQGTTNQQGFGTKAIHAGQPPDPTSGGDFLFNFIGRSLRVP
jgi:hypothetical protein